MRKTKKKKQNKLIIGSLCILTGLLLFMLTYLDSQIDKENIELISYNENTVFTNVENNELLKILNEKTGAVLFINSRENINKLINILHSLNNKEKLYVYNVKNEELILELNEQNQIEKKQESTTFYKLLIDKLGAYSDKYLLKTDKGEIIDTKERKIYTPLVLFIKNGKILYSHYISGEEKNEEELIEIYKKGYEIISEEYSS